MRRVLIGLLLGLPIAPVLLADVVLIESRQVKFARSGKDGGSGHPGGAIGSVAVIDAQGLEYLLNTNITNTDPSSTSGAAANATFTRALAASTSGGRAATAVPQPGRLAVASANPAQAPLAPSAENTLRRVTKFAPRKNLP
jgi:hypothetical protein